jgi:hypothetical protein
LPKRLGLTRAIWVVGAAYCAQPPIWSEGSFERRYSDLMRHSELQFSFNQADPPSPPPGWLAGVLHLLSKIAPAFNWLFWIVLALVAALLLYFIGREIWTARWGHKEKAAAAPPVQAPRELSPQKARALLSEADRLAATGQYELAARTLLHRSIEDIEERRPNSVRQSYTAREIEAAGLPERLRTAFALIARSVEESWFGGRPLQRSQWLSCRSAYEPFTASEAWSS